MITVFYDGKCGLCSKEINHYRKIAPEGIFNWQDVTENTEGLDTQGIDLATALMHLHAQDADGKMHVGVDAFLIMWKQIKYWRFLGVIVGLPVIKQITQMFYQVFAVWRFKRSAHCQVAAKQQA